MKKSFRAFFTTNCQLFSEYVIYLQHNRRLKVKTNIIIN